MASSSNSSSSEPPPNPFLQALFSTYTPTGGKLEPAPIILNAASTPRDFTRLNPLAQPLYRSHGRWAWIDELPIEDFRDEVVINRTEWYITSLRIGRAGNRDIMYMNKSWRKREKAPSTAFVTELAMYKFRLKDLQGKQVPSVIGVRTTSDSFDVLMELPHQSFFIEASPDMPDVLKRRAIAALEQQHAKGIHYRNLKLSNILIGGDGRITFINHHECHSLGPNPDLHISPATPADIRLELRQLKFLLDLDQAREKERQQILETAAREKRNSQSKLHYQLYRQYPPNYEHPSENEKLNPALHPSQMRDWFDSDHKPRRFVAPGLSASEFKGALQQFLRVLVGMERADIAAGLPPTDVSELYVGDPEPQRMGPTTRAQSKRKALDAEIDEPPAKRLGSIASADDNPEVNFSVNELTRFAPQPIKYAGKHGDTKFKDRHIGSFEVEQSVYINNLHPSHPFIVVKDYAYAMGQNPLPAKRRREDAARQPSPSHKNKKRKLSGRPAPSTSWRWNPFKLFFTKPVERPQVTPSPVRLPGQLFTPTQPRPSILVSNQSMIFSPFSALKYFIPNFR